MKIAIGSDHRGYKLKEKIKDYLGDKHVVKDFGCFSEEPVDYPDFGKPVAIKVSEGLFERGILICDTGIGMSMVANHYKNVRAALCRNEEDAEKSRLHNDSNILVFGAKYFLNDEFSYKTILDKWLTTDFEGGRHERRVMKIDKDIAVSASMLSKPPMPEETMAKFIVDLEKSGIDSIHWDVMDGKYNANNTWDYQGSDTIKKLRIISKLPFVAHLMIKDPIEKIRLFNEAGCNTIIIHYEACKNINETVKKIKSYGRCSGVAIEPDTPVEKIVDYLPILDEVLVMSVNTGYAGQGFIDMTGKIKYLDNIRKELGLDFKIAVDGGINDATGKLCRDAGADILVSASYIQKSDYKSAIDSMRGF
jgi:ribulose-phosphate 3-epimerase